MKVIISNDECSDKINLLDKISRRSYLMESKNSAGMHGYS